VVTVVTKTIGPTGRDYTTFTLAEAAVESIATAEFGSTDLVANDGAIVFEADAGTYSESVNVSSLLTTDATRQVTYKPAAGSEHGGVLDGGVLITQTSSPSNYTLGVGDNFTKVFGLGLQQVGTSRVVSAACHGFTLDSCVIESDTTTTRCLWVNWSPTAPPAGATNTISNNVFINGFVSLWHNGGSSGVQFDLINNTHTGLEPQRNWDIYHVPDTSYNVVNNLVTNPATSGFGTWLDQGGGGTATITGSNNFGGSLGPFPAAIQGSPYPITPTTSFSTPLGSGDFAVYMGATGALADVTGNDVWQQGVGPGTNSDVPTTDINGVARSGASCNPGAFEADGFVAPTVITRTIGPVGRDFATFTLAEASLPTEDITFTNRAFVFEADAATYSENVTFSSSLTTDATRQVTYKPAAGSEHGGVPSTGVVLQSTTGITAFDDHMTLRGLCYLQTSTTTSGSTGIGLLFDQIIYEYAAGVQYGTFMVCTSALFPSRWQNSVLFAQGVSGGDRRGFIASHNNISGHVEVVNCTVVAEDPAVVGFWTQTFGTGTCQFKLVNCVRLGASIGKAFNNSGSGSTVTGSNNFGPSTNPFPAAIQGSPYPITPTTNTTPGFGDYAIYEAATGALIVVDDNAALGGGVGPAANADVPVFDINGVKRIGGGCDPGAFEGVRSRSTDVWDVVTATHTTPGTFGELLHQVYLLTRTAAGGRIV